MRDHLVGRVGSVLRSRLQGNPSSGCVQDVQTEPADSHVRDAVLGVGPKGEAGVLQALQLVRGPLGFCRVDVRAQHRVAEYLLQGLADLVAAADVRLQRAVDGAVARGSKNTIRHCSIWLASA